MLLGMFMKIGNESTLLLSSGVIPTLKPVSYTHLDVYKRQDSSDDISSDTDMEGTDYWQQLKVFNTLVIIIASIYVLNKL